MQILNKINSFMWGTPLLLLVLFTGVILTVRTRFFQIRFFGASLKTFFGADKTTRKSGQPSALGAACTALAGTMGVGNIVGVAGAISLGGAGAVFWMWVSALFSMIVKFAEIALSVRYREQNRDGSRTGGAMYYIKNALPKIFSPLAIAFSACGVAAAFGIGNLVQINVVASSTVQMLKALVTLSPQIEFYIKLMTGIICAVLCAFVLKNDGVAGSFCKRMMPILTITYMLLTLGAIAVNYKNLPSVFACIFKGAFSPHGVTGGAVGSAFVGMRYGFARGVFSNEAGMGTAPTAYAASDGDEVSLGLMGITEVFIDTVVVCTLTSLAILCSVNIKYGLDLSTTLTLTALDSVYGERVLFVFCPVVIFFALSSTIGWGLYGTKFMTFLFGTKSKNVFLFIFIAAMIPAAVFRAEAAWIIAEILNGFMIIPNTVALLYLTNEVADITNNAQCTMHNA
ncbi:MAG: amino acid carrier protein [Clostridia bacterium]|nr:amino acid carrier protein [Clostridia bacterium]